MMYVLGRVEGHDDLTDRDRDLTNKIGCMVTNIRAAHMILKNLLRTRQAHHSKANCLVRVITHVTL